MPTGTVHLHRVLRAPPERVYRAFVEPDALAKWLPPHGFACSVERFEARVGGAFRMSFRNFSNGQVHSFGGEFRTLTPGRYLEYSDRFDDPNLAGEVVVKVTLEAVLCGTSLRIEQSGLPEAIPVEMCYLGWQDSLQQLAALAEPDIPAG